MVQWETSFCLDTLIHFENDSLQSQRFEIAKFLQAHMIAPNMSCGKQSLLSSCVSRAIMLVLQLRLSYRYNHFYGLQDWTKNGIDNDNNDNRRKNKILNLWQESSCQGTSLAPTIEDLLHAYVNSPPGYFHVSCECELRWYFKMIEDCITHTELDILNNDEPAGYIRVESGILTLECALERVVIVGAHFSPTVVAVGP